MPFAFFRLKTLHTAVAVTAFGFCVGSAQAQLPLGVPGKPGVPVRRATVRLSTLIARERSNPTRFKVRRAIHEPATIFPRIPGLDLPQPAAEEDGDVESSPSMPRDPYSPAPSASFLGLLDDSTSIPPDTQGAVGPNHVLTMLNTQIQVQDKTGVIKSGPLSLNAFWSSILDNANSQFAFDPHVTYDPYNSRWIAVADAAVAQSNGTLTESEILVAVSATSDPTGTWTFYSIPTDTTNAYWADYPTLGFNKNWIVISVNMFSNSSGNTYSQIFALNKASYYAAGAGTYHAFNDSNGFTMCPVVTYDNTTNTEYLVEDWNGGAGQLRLSTITGTATAPVLTSGTSNPATSATWADAVNGDFESQSGTTNKINSGDARIINSVFRNGSIWCSHTVYLPAGGPNRTAAQWWQIAPAGTVQQVGRVDDSSGTISRAYPSIAVNANNDMLLGYAHFSPTTYASAYYAFRKSTDAVNTLQAEALLQAGQAPYYKTYGGSRNRWGDYSSTVVDPSDDQNFWSLQEYATTPASGEDRWSTWWAKIPASVTFAVGKVIVSPARISGGNYGLAVLTMTTGAPAPTTINLVSSAPTVASIPATLTLAKGQSTAKFRVKTYPVAKDTLVTISCILNHLRVASHPTVTAQGLGLLTVNPGAVEGGNPTIMTIRLINPAAAGGAVVTLKSSNPAIAPLPSSVTIPAGASSLGLLIDTDLVDTTTTITFTASLGAATTSATLTVNP